MYFHDITEIQSKYEILICNKIYKNVLGRKREYKEKFNKIENIYVIFFPHVSRANS